MRSRISFDIEGIGKLHFVDSTSEKVRDGLSHLTYRECFAMFFRSIGYGSPPAGLPTMTTVLLGVVALARSAGMFCSRNASVPVGLSSVKRYTPKSLSFADRMNLALAVDRFCTSIGKTKIPKESAPAQGTPRLDPIATR